MKTRVKIGIYSVTEKLAMIALLKDRASHDGLIADLSTALEKDASFVREYDVDAQVSAP